MKPLIVTLFAIAVTSGAVAQTAPQPCDPDSAATAATCTVSGAKAFYLKQAAVTVPALDAEARENLTAAVDRAKKDVVTANRAQTAPQTFAAHIHNSYEDFLNLFSFAINKVDESDNGQALIIRFNPLRQGSLLVGTTLTVAQPVVADVVKNAIPETSRDSTVSALDKLQGNRNDLTFSVAASGATTNCKADEPATRCWGRTPSAYRDVFDKILLTVVRSHRSSFVLDRSMKKLFLDKNISLADQLTSKATDHAQLINLLRESAGLDRTEAASALELYKANHLDLIATMIDNQPQASGTISIHRPPTYGGPRSAAGSVELHFGRMNVNTLRGMCTGKSGKEEIGPCLHDALASIAESGMATDKWVFNASYDRLQHYRLDSLGLDNSVDFTPINVPQSDVLKVKGQGGLQLGTEVMGKPTRADFSLEGGFNQKGNVRSNNRWVGTATFSIPFGDMMTVPVSVTWANKAEFIGDVKNRIGAHIGLTYRLPGLFGTK